MSADTLVTLSLAVLLLPLAGFVLMMFFGKKLPRQGDWLETGIITIALGIALYVLYQKMTTFAGEVGSLRFTWVDFHEVPGIGPLKIVLGFAMDNLAAIMMAVVMIISTLVHFFSIGYMHDDVRYSRYFGYLGIFTFSMLVIVLADNLFLLYVGWELVGLSSYLLIGHWYEKKSASNAAMKAFITNRVGDLGFFIGMAIMFTTFHTFGLKEIFAGLQSGQMPLGSESWLTVAGVLIFCGAIGKSAQFPLHVWLPDAMEGPTPVSALIHAATMVNAGIYLLARFYPAFEHAPGWTMSVLLVGLISAFTAALSALIATDLKRALAYSTVSQLGYMVFAIGAGGVFASQFHLLSHAVFKALLFLAAGSVIHSVGTRDMRRMGGLGEKMPFVRNVFIIGALALAGVPIFNGFWSKELILEVGLEHSPIWAYGIMLLGAGLTAFYTFRMVWLVFFGAAREELHVHRAGDAMRVALGILAVSTCVTWLFFGGLNGLFSTTLPFHDIEHESLLEVVTAILSAPATWFALLVVGLGFVIAYIRMMGFKYFGGGILQPLVDTSFGFDSLNTLVVKVVSNFAERLRATQTGELNWNILGIIGGLLVVLVVLWMGA